ncbi:MAG TPA: hypothetical protein DDX16_07275, partial [Candidatus Omnitrophica bacterium]|nr:hypothetical protein [Candidatus Omnitrophota bacterium]
RKPSSSPVSKRTEASSVFTIPAVSPVAENEHKEQGVVPILPILKKAVGSQVRHLRLVLFSAEEKIASSAVENESYKNILEYVEQLYKYSGRVVYYGTFLGLVRTRIKDVDGLFGKSRYKHVTGQIEQAIYWASPASRFESVYTSPAADFDASTASWREMEEVMDEQEITKPDRFEPVILAFMAEPFFKMFNREIETDLKSSVKITIEGRLPFNLLIIESKKYLIKRLKLTESFAWMDEEWKQAIKEIKTQSSPCASEPALPLALINKAIEKQSFLPEDVLSQYIAKENIPRSIVFKPEVYEDNKFRIIYTKSDDFEAITVITSREELPSVLTLGGVRFLEPRQDKFQEKSAALLKDALVLVERMDLTNVLWSNPMDGAVVVILKNPASEKSKFEILKFWTQSLVAAGFAGQQLIVKLELGTDELDMSVIQGAYKKSLVELAKRGVDISRHSEIFATSRRLKDGGWPQRKWKLTAQGAKRNLDTLLDLLKKYSYDLSRFKFKPGEKVGVIIHGAGFIGLTMAEVLSLDKNYILRGLADAEAAIYNHEGLDSNILNTLAKKGKPVKEYLRYKEARLLRPEELLRQEADILITASVDELINENNYAGIKARVIFEAANNSVNKNVIRPLQDKGVLYVPWLIINGGGGYAAFEEYFHTVAAKIKDWDFIREHVESKILENARFLAWVFFNLWLKEYRGDKSITLFDIIYDKAKEIRQARDIYRYKPTTEVTETAEFKVSRRDIPEYIAWRLAARDLARRKTMLENLDIKQLKQILADGTQEEQELAAYILGEMADTRNTKELTTVAEDEKRSIAARIKAIEALGKIGAEEVVETLERIIKQESALHQLSRLALSAESYSDRTHLVKQAKWSLGKIVGIDADKYLERKSHDLSKKTRDLDDALIEEQARAILRKWRKRKWWNWLWGKDEAHSLAAITGFSASGKTYFSLKLIEVLRRLAPEYAFHGIVPAIIQDELDHYLFAVEDRKSKLFVLGMFDPAQLKKWIGKWDFALFFEHVKALFKGMPIDKPVFNQITRKREPHTERIDPRNAIIIIEGIFVLTNAQTNSFYDFSFFVDAPSELRRNRGIQRYLKESKYAQNTYDEVLAKEARKGLTEDLPRVQHQKFVAGMIISSAKHDVPEYVKDFQKALHAYREMAEKSPELSMEQREKISREEFFKAEYGGIRGSPEDLQEKI